MQGQVSLSLHNIGCVPLDAKRLLCSCAHLTYTFLSFLQHLWKSHLGAFSCDTKKIENEGSVLSVLCLSKHNLHLERALNLQLRQDGLPENSTFRQTVINLTKDIWESHRWPKIMTLVFWPETRHHWNCLPARLQHRGLCLLSQRLCIFFLEQFSENHLHKDGPQRNNDDFAA